MKSYISASAVSLLAGLAAFTAWYLGVVPSSLPHLELLIKTDSLIRLAPEIVGGGTVALALISGLALNRFGARKCVVYLAVGVLFLAVVCVVASRFLSLDIPFLPAFIAIFLAASLVQLSHLLNLDRQLVKSLMTNSRQGEFVTSGEAKTRLMSGLELLSTVLPITEAVVFRCSSEHDFEAVARLKPRGTDQLADTNRNSVWRDGVKLGLQAVKTKDLAIHSVDERWSNVAVPLKQENEIVGALLVRLNGLYCEDDRPLLEAVGAQFARNLKREDYSTNSFDNPILSFFSTVSSTKKLDALSVLRAVSTEQRCESSALNEIHDGLAIAYLDGTIAQANSNLLSFAELTNEQLKDTNLFGLLDRFRTDVFDEPAIAIRRVLQTGIDYEGELTFDLKNQILGLRISLLRENLGDRNEPIGLAIFIRELTRIKEYEKLKSDMISLMSHELRTPLTSINGFAELLTVDDTIPEQAKEFVTIIANESQRMSRMINTFLAVTQLERKDKQEVLKIPLRLDEVVRDTVTTLQPVAKKKRIRLVEQPAHRLPPVAADKSLITQAVKNLVKNAIKYSPERTTVTVSTALEAESIRVVVEDRGFGIPAESKDRVWEKFYRVVREGQEKDEESTGLGLSFVREVVEQHGGSVALDSEEGRGSKFSFTLPRL